MDTYVHTHAYTHTHTHSLTHLLTHALTPSHPHIHSRSRSRSLSLSHAQCLAHTVALPERMALCLCVQRKSKHEKRLETKWEGGLVPSKRARSVGQSSRSRTSLSSLGRMQLLKLRDTVIGMQPSGRKPEEIEGELKYGPLAQQQSM